MIKFLTLGALSVLTLATATAEAPLNQQDVVKIMEAHLLENPEIIMKSLETLQKKQLIAKKETDAKAISKNHAALFESAKDPFLGDPKASQSVVVFVDPYCGHCRNFHQMIKESLTPKDDLRILIKDLPLFGEPSQLAVAALIAAKVQNKYDDFYDHISKTETPLKKEELIDLAKKTSGLDLAKFQTDMTSKETLEIIKGHETLAQALGITGTPALIVGSSLIEGAVPLERIKEALNEPKTTASTETKPQV